MEIADQISLIKDSVSIMIPVVTGFILFFGSTLIRQLQTAKSNNQMPWKIADLSMFFALISLYICFGTMNICIRASLGEPAIILFFVEALPKELIVYARNYLSGSYICFGISISFAVIYFLRIIKNK
jgi:uncharacterized membrane protein SirB2